MRNYVSCFVVFLHLILEYQYVKSSGSSQSTPLASSKSKNSCKMLKTTEFHLDLECIALHSSSNSIVNEVLAPTEDVCKDICCISKEGICDLTYWDSSHKCLVMNYYILKLCPSYFWGSATVDTASSAMVMFSISNRVPLQIKHQLLSEGYRKQLQELLGCKNDEYVCQDWNCISKKFVCDGIPHCSDGSDERQCGSAGKCLGSNGKHYEVGEEYTPYGEMDGCKICICGNNSHASYCYSPLCNPKSFHSCKGNHPDVCCRCYGTMFTDDDVPADESYFSTSQRLLVTCMCVLVIVSLLLFFSRNITHRGLRSAQRGRNGNATSVWFPSNPDDLPPNRSFFGHYSTHDDGVTFFNRDGHPAINAGAPPPYNTLKPVESGDTTTDEMGEPPSYPGSQVSVDSRPTDQNGDEETSIPRDSENEPIRQSDSGSEPISPISTSSQSPLITNERSNVQSRPVHSN